MKVEIEITCLQSLLSNPYFMVDKTPYPQTIAHYDLLSLIGKGQHGHSSPGARPGNGRSSP
ncbi:MAG: hypothetical protein M5U34_16715 [Chloroflexi bacterium]|nr:hypothetical protein [Chloroflexota bacterium]